MQPSKYEYYSLLTLRSNLDGYLICNLSFLQLYIIRIYTVNFINILCSICFIRNYFIFFSTDVIQFEEKENLPRPSRPRTRRPGLPTGLESRDREVNSNNNLNNINNNIQHQSSQNNDNILQRLRDLQKICDVMEFV